MTRSSFSSQNSPLSVFYVLQSLKKVAQRGKSIVKVTKQECLCRKKTVKPLAGSYFNKKGAVMIKFNSNLVNFF